MRRKEALCRSAFICAVPRPRCAMRALWARTPSICERSATSIPRPTRYDVLGSRHNTTEHEQLGLMKICPLRVNKGPISTMKVLALTIVFLMLALIAFGGSPSRIRVGQASPEVHDYLYAEPFRGSKIGNTLARACGNCHSNQTNLPCMAISSRSRGGSRATSARAVRN